MLCLTLILIIPLSLSPETKYEKVLQLAVPEEVNPELSKTVRRIEPNELYRTGDENIVETANLFALETALTNKS